MLSPRSDSPGDDSSTVIVQPENRFGNANGVPAIGWSTEKGDDQPTPDAKGPMPSYLTEIHLSHKQITKRFAELLNLFEDYTKILDSEHEHLGRVGYRLKRVQSEQLVMKEDDQERRRRGSSTMLNESDCKAKTLATCEVSSQTSCSTLEQRQADIKDLKKKLETKGGTDPTETEKPSKVLQHTIHIEVESVTSATEMQRPPLRQRMWHVLVQAADTVVACAYMIGENFTYVLFIVLCLWCLYLLMGHYYSFLQNNVNQQND
ncbi:hypothetical protein KR009_009275, partial [Drosophila setifemur]